MDIAPPSTPLPIDRHRVELYSRFAHHRTSPEPAQAASPVSRAAPLPERSLLPVGFPYDAVERSQHP